jgi:hypothetical protein
MSHGVVVVKVLEAKGNLGHNAALISDPMENPRLFCYADGYVLTFLDG